MEKKMISVDGMEMSSVMVQTLVVGSGAAGWNAAVSVYKNGQRDVAVLTEGRNMGTSFNTGSDKQTYYKMTTAGSEQDSVRKMAECLFSGSAMDGDLALCEAAYSLRGFYHLVDIGVPFPNNAYGEYVGYKTDHDPNQRGTSAGPLTSKYMTEKLREEAERYGIPVLDGLLAIELLTKEEKTGRRVCGLLALNRKADDPAHAFVLISAENIIYAVGGEAGMYAASVYPVSQTGGMGIAFRAGALGKNLTESQYGIASIKFRWNLSGTYQQALPCYFSTDQNGEDVQEFLSPFFKNGTDQLNAIFLKGYQWPFDPRKTMNYGSSLIDLLVYRETVLLGRKVYLDYRKNPSALMSGNEPDFARLGDEAYQYLKKSGGLCETPIERLAQMNPNAIELYRSHGIDLYHEPLDIAVCAQHNNGGLAANCWWESNLKHLFPVGEVNGTHGVYRPGGSALNSGQVGSLRAAEYITAVYSEAPEPCDKLAVLCREQIQAAIAYGCRAMEKKGEKFCYKTEKQGIGERMSAYGAIIRTEEGVKAALQECAEQQKRVEEQSHLEKICDLADYYRLRDLLVCQQMYLSAIQNYIRHGGISRGSYLICSRTGKKPLEALPDIFRFSFEDDPLKNMIQEMAYLDGKCADSWRAVRPIPCEDNWFESVWKACREKSYYSVNFQK